MHVARDLSKGHIRSALELERTWTAVAGARAINNGGVMPVPITQWRNGSIGLGIGLVLVIGLVYLLSKRL
jgi:hypothetical protein